MVGKIRVKWVKSAIGFPKKQKRTIKALGLRRLNHEIVKEATPQVLGMINRVRHLVQCEEEKS